MVKVVPAPSVIKAAGNKPKEIREHIGRINTHTSEISVAYMKSPQGWEEPGQTPDFDEYTIVLKGTLKVETKRKIFNVTFGQAVIAFKGEWVKYSTPFEEGAEYIAICLPAFSEDKVNRDTP